MNQRNSWIASFLLLFSSAVRADLQPGDSAPAFRLLDQNGRPHSLADHAGRWLVIYFYPKDDTPGCTTEACRFRDDIFAFRKMHVDVLGISLDDQQSHQRFAEKYALPFSLLVDEKGEITQAYGALWKLWPLTVAKRHSFIIDPKGKIARIYRAVDPKTHSQQLIADLAQLKGVANPINPAK